MVSVEGEDLAKLTVKELMISSEKVAHVQGGNPLDHALLILIKSGYSAVPVLDATFRLKGIISKSNILDNVMGIERFEMEKLNDKKVEEVMKVDVPYLKESDNFLKGLKSVIDNPFVCVVDDEHSFTGILTRRTILKQVTKNIYTNGANSSKNKQ